MQHSNVVIRLWARWRCCSVCGSCPELAAARRWFGGVASLLTPRLYCCQHGRPLSQDEETNKVSTINTGWEILTSQDDESKMIIFGPPTKLLGSCNLYYFVKSDTYFLLIIASHTPRNIFCACVQFAFVWQWLILPAPIIWQRYNVGEMGWTRGRMGRLGFAWQSLY